MAETAGEKTEKPTAKRLQEAKRNGDYLQSRELSTAMVVIVGVVWIVMTGPSLMHSVKEMLAAGLSFGTQDINDFQPGERAYNLIRTVLGPFGAVVIVSALAAIAVPTLLGSLHFNAGAWQPKFGKLNPIKGAKRFVSLNGFFELGKSILKVALIGTISGWVLWQRIGQIRMMGKSGIESAIGEVGSIFTLVVLALAGCLFLLAAIDVPIQMFQRNKRLMMSKQEVKDEHKDQDGNPQIKQAIRNRAVQNLTKAMRKNMEGASVVLTNPTHFAVALRYHPGRDAAPVIVARGADEVAAAIRDVAAEKSIPVLQYPELTRAIFYTTQVGQFIDERLFMAVATVLAFVFRIENKLATEMDRPHIDLPDDLRFDSDGRKIVN